MLPSAGTALHQTHTDIQISTASVRTFVYAISHKFKLQIKYSSSTDNKHSNQHSGHTDHIKTIITASQKIPGSDFIFQSENLCACAKQHHLYAAEIDGKQKRISK